MNRYKQQFNETSDIEIQNYFVSLFELYSKDPEFIGRFIFTLLNNAIIKASNKNKKVDKIKLQRSIFNYLKKMGI